MIVKWLKVVQRSNETNQLKLYTEPRSSFSSNMKCAQSTTAPTVASTTPTVASTDPTIASTPPSTTPSRAQSVKLFIRKRFNFASFAKTSWSGKVKSGYRNRFKVLSIPLQILIVWSLFEIILCFTVLCYKSADYPENFITSICAENRCSNYLVAALQGRMLLSLVSIIGILMVRYNASKLLFLLQLSETIVTDTFEFTF